MKKETSMLLHDERAFGDIALGTSPLKLFILIGVLSLLSLVAAGCKAGHAAIPNIVTEVQVAQPIQRDVPIHNEWVASLDGYVNAEIHPQVSGYMVRQNYKEGSVVRKGQVLFEIDPRPFQATLDRTKGELAQAEVSLAKSTMDVDRDTPLVAQKAIPKAQLDTEIQAKLAARGRSRIEQGGGRACRTRSRLDESHIPCGWCCRHCRSPDGQFGRTQLPPHLGFASRSHQGVLPRQRTGVSAGEETHLNGQPMELFDSSPELILADGTVYPHKGKILLTDRQVDTNTGTIRLVAAFPNPGNILRPASMGACGYETGMKKNALLVPQSAVKEIQGGYQVALLGPDNKAIIRPVKAGEKVGDDVGDRRWPQAGRPGHC